MTDHERIEQLARWNRAEGNAEAARQLEALLAKLSTRMAEARQTRQS